MKTRLDNVYCFCLSILCVTWTFSLFAWVKPLTLEEKAGQVLMVHFHGRDANEEAQRLIQEAHVGGIIYYHWANALTSPEQVYRLSAGLQKLARQAPAALPLLIAIDQEGGMVSRLKAGFTIFPGNGALGKTKRLEWGIDSAAVMGKELRAVGIQLNFAPVVDLNAGSVMGLRTFSSDPQEVANWGKAILQGYRQAHVSATLKHFPGHGSATVDSHEALPVILKDRATLELQDLLPFRQLAAQADVVMTSHLLVPALDKNHCVTFSSAIVSDLLRREFNFQGVICTDSLVMQGILSQADSIEEVVLKSLQAGHDLILLGGKQLLDSRPDYELTVDDVVRIQRFIVQAVRSGKLKEERLNAAVERILALKKSLNLFVLDDSSDHWKGVGIEEHQQLAKQMAREALQVVKGKNLLPLNASGKKILILAPLVWQEMFEQAHWQWIDCKSCLSYYDKLDPEVESMAELVRQAASADYCFFFAYNSARFAGQRQFIQALAKQGPLTAVVEMGHLQHPAQLHSAPIVLETYGPASPSIQAAFDRLQGLP